MTYTLRTYQVEAVTAALKGLTQYQKPFVIQAATGAGKSLIIADICHRLDEPVLVLQPSKELLEQNYAKLQSYGVEDISIYSASKKSKEISKFTYATIGSIYKKPELFAHFKYVIIDECHLVNPKNIEGMYTTFLNAIGCQRVCGLTATPYRLQQKYFNEDGQLFYTSYLKMINRIHPFFFKQIVYKVETAELIEQGYLCPIQYYTFETDLSGLEINSTGANFTEDSLDVFWNDKKLARLVATVHHIDSHHKMNLVFCSSVRQATRLKEALTKMGMNAEIVTGETPTKEREQIVDDFRKGNIRHLLNVGVFTTGFDVPQLDCVTLARPTMSLALYYQMVGRGVRKDPDDPNKVLAVYDHAGVVERMGRVESIRLAKEDDGFRDKVVSDSGDCTEVPLFKYLVKNRSKARRTV